MKNKEIGALVISLDFELFWGIADIGDIKSWEKEIQKVYEIVPRTLALFEKYGIHATWATVAGIMLENKNELYEYLPQKLPQQTEEIIQKFNFEDENNSIPSFMLFGQELVDRIKNAVNQEIGTHTFTHYYCSKQSSNTQDFKNELETASLIMEKKGYGKCKTVVFPRNQVSQKYVSAMPNNIRIYRGSISGFIDKIKKKNKLIGTIIWYFDHYIPLQNSTYSISKVYENGIFNIKLSRLFKAYKDKYRFAEKLKIKRYIREMEYAAKHRKIYHICWHPHNFSTFTEKNFEQLEELLKKFGELNKKYGMLSMNMYELARYIEREID